MCRRRGKPGRRGRPGGGRTAGDGAQPGPLGFTLIELLVAMSLLAVVLALLFGGFFQISGSSAALNRRLIEPSDLRRPYLVRFPCACFCRSKRSRCLRY